MAFFVFQKIAWTPHRSKRFYVPLPEFAATNTILLAYWSRPKSLDRLPLLQWLREFDTSKIQPKPYKKGKTLVGARQTSVFRDEYFFQDMLLHMPHRCTNDFDIPGVEEIPQVIRYFVGALHHRSCVWANNRNIRELFELQGHKTWYITNILLHVQSLKDLYKLYQKRVISFGELTLTSISDHPLDTKQKLVVSLVKKC